MQADPELRPDKPLGGSGADQTNPAGFAVTATFYADKVTALG
jgi:hypothetical protein